MKGWTSLFLLSLMCSPAFAEEQVTAPSIETTETPTPTPKKGEESTRGAFRGRQFEAFSVPDYQVDEALHQKMQEEIRLLSSIVKKTSDPNKRADRLFRIAELYWLDNRAKYFRQMDQYNKQMDLFVQGKLKKKPVEPKFNGEASFKIFKEIIATAPHFDRMDEVLHRAGYSSGEIGDDEAAFKYYQTLVTKYPKSRFRLDAYMEIGEYYFGKRRFNEAIASFNIVLREPSKLYNFALYKVSWCLYNQGKVRPAMSVMQKVVKDSKGVKSELDLREEALKDLVLFYSDLGLIDEAQEYFTSIGEPEYGFKVLRKLAGIYYDQARYSKATEAYKRLLAADPFAEDAPRNHSRLVECYEKSQNLPAATNEMETFIATYDKQGQWWTRNTDTDSREYAYDRSEVYARFMAKKYHEIAQKSDKSNPDEAARQYRQADLYYKKYLEKFGDHRNAYQMRFLYAELLFKNKNYTDAAAQYELVSRAKKEDKYRKPAAIGLIDSLSRLEEVYFKDLEQKGVKKKEVYEPIPLSPYAQRLIEGDENYVRNYPTDPKVPDTLLHRGQLYYNYNQFDKALYAFNSLVQKFPTAPASNTARNLILDIYNIRKDWGNLEKYAAQYMQDKTFATPENKAFLLKLIQGSIFQRAKAMEEKKDFPGAAQMYMRLTNLYPDSEYADKALFNAAIAYINADDSKNAMTTAQRFLKKYPNSNMVPKMMLALASYFDDKLDYVHAAEYYEYLAERDPKSQYAADALFNAGLYRENLRHYKRALEDYDNYLKRYPQAKDAPEIFFSMGLIHEKEHNWTEAAAVFKAFPRRFGGAAQNKSRVIESYYRLGQAMVKLRQMSGAEEAYRTAVVLNRRYNKDPSLSANIGGKYAAKSQFELTEPQYKDFEAIKLRMPQRALANAIEKKAELLKRLKNQYLEIITYGDAEMGVAALARIGMVYQNFSQALFNAPIPKELNPEQVQLYQQELQNRAAPIEEKATEAFEKAVKKAFELEVYTDWTQKAYENLTQYKPAEYPPRRGQMKAVPKVSEPYAPYKPSVEANRS